MVPVETLVELKVEDKKRSWIYLCRVLFLRLVNKKGRSFLRNYDLYVTNDLRMVTICISTCVTNPLYDSKWVRNILSFDSEYF